MAGRQGGESGRDRPAGEGGLREGSDDSALEHRAHPSFWDDYNELPKRIQDTADRKFELLKQNPDHPSLDFKPVKDTEEGKFHRAKVTQKKYRAVVLRVGKGLYIWFCIDVHDVYERVIS